MLPYIEPASDAAGVPKASAADRTRHASVKREKGPCVRIRRADEAVQKAHAAQGADVMWPAPHHVPRTVYWERRQQRARVSSARNCAAVVCVG
jgi:hypothetical protein